MPQPKRRTSHPPQPGRQSRTPATPSAKISACLIVRNEAHNLRRCLASLAGLDEIVVVDTGSTDDTVAVAREHGARVFDFPWCDDFSAARNESLRHATGDWLLYVDADEELVERTPGALRQLCAGLGADEAGACLTIDCPTDEQGLGTVVGEQWRLFRNNWGILFAGRIHEQLRLPGRRLLLRAAGDHGAQLRHWGYVPSGDLIARKGERNRRLLELSIVEEPRQPAHLFHLGRQHAWEGNFEQARQALTESVALWKAVGRPADGYVPSMFSTLALAAHKTGDDQRVLEVEADTPEGFVSSELLYIAGMACWRLGRIDGAIDRLTRALRDSSLAKATGGDPSTAGWRPAAALADIYTGLGRLADAKEALTMAGTDTQRPELAARLAAIDLREQARPVVTACMIVRNEAGNLRRRMAAIRAAVDQLVVVDTGSTDDTVAVAESFGADVHHVAWCDDFAAARNESLRHAVGDWIIWVDADDELVEQTPDALRRLCREIPTAVWGCWIPCHSVINQNGEVGVSLKQLRLFRNRLGIRFRGRIHEQPLPPDGYAEPGITTHDAVQIRHWGYLAGQADVGQKLARNRRLLQLAMAEEPDQPFHCYSLGKQLVWEHDYTGAEEVLLRGISLWESQGRTSYRYLAPMFAAAVCAALNAGRPAEALAVEARCPADAVSSDLLYYAAIACYRLGQPHDAVNRLTRAFGDPSVGQASETDASTATWRPRLLLGQICMELNQREDAYRHAMDALDMMPDRADVLFSGAMLAVNMGQTEQASKLARRVLAGSEDNGFKARAQELLVKLAEN